MLELCWYDDYSATAELSFDDKEACSNMITTVNRGYKDLHGDDIRSLANES